MGSWSVYCSISQMAITETQNCVLLPLKKARDVDYLPYVPATLPIFGYYNDYGCIGGIEENLNTKLIEEHFGITIQELCDLLSDGIPIDRSEAKEVLNKMKHADELKSWKYMWIDRKVYDFMSTHLDKEIKGDLEFGSKEILELIGFKYLGENTNNKSYDPKRFKQEWEFQGMKFYSDGRRIQNEEGMSIYRFDCWFNADNSLKNMVQIPEDKLWIGERAMCQMWKYVSKHKAKELLTWIIDKKYYDDGILNYLDELIAKLEAKLEANDAESDPVMQKLIKERNAEKKEPKDIGEKYVINIDKFGDGLAELVIVRHNLYPMSGCFNPYILYLTPQCGEYRSHQVLLEKFAEINKQRFIELGGEE